MSIAVQRSHKVGTRNKSLLGIRARLVLLALLAVVPLLADRVHMLEVRRAERAQIASAEALALARRGAESQREAITTLRAVMRVLAHTYLNVSAKGNGCDVDLADFAHGIAWITGLSIVGPDGRVKCSTSPGVTGLNLSDRPYIQTALTDHRFALSDYLIGRLHRAPTVIAALPIVDEGQTRGIVLASVGLEWLAQLSQLISDHSGGGIVLVDAKGTVLTGHDGPKPFVGKSEPTHPLVRAMLAQPQGSLTTTGFDGIRRIFGFVTVPWTKARLAVGLDEAAVLAQINSQIGMAYLQLVAFTLMALIIAWVAGDRMIVAPIRAMARTVARFGRGDLDSRLERERCLAEFVPLVEAFNDMASRLTERERELQSKNQHLAQLASIDALCGLTNRRGFDTRLDVEWERARVAGEPLALLMIDVDHFKLFNDTYGHVEGDICLRRIADALKAAAREPNFAARYGGEEFAILLQNTDYRQALTTAERLRAGVAGLGISHDQGTTGRLTLSIGVACIIPTTDTPAALVEAADSALYTAKRGGRNAVAFSSEIIVTEAGLPLAKAS